MKHSLIVAKVPELHHVVLTPMFPPVRFGGIEKIVYHLVDEMRMAGENVSVCSLSPRKGVAIDSTHRESSLVTRIPCEGTDLKSILAVQSTLAKSALDLIQSSSLRPIIHVHDWFAALAFELIRAKTNALGLVFFHGDKLAEYNGILDPVRNEIHLLQKRLARQADVIMCYSDFMRRTICESFSMEYEKVKLFRCGLDSPCSHTSRINRNCNEPLKLLYRGRLASEKSVDTLIHAVASLKREINVTLTIRGDGPTRSKLECLVGELNAVDCISFHPFSADAQDLENDLLNCDAFILPSRFEPFGLVILEAIARDVPVVVANCGGPAEIVRDEISGLTFEVGSVSGLIGCIRNLYYHPDSARERTRQAKLESLTKFNWKNAALRVISTSYACYDNCSMEQEAACG
jgi:glycosyltransferase involved in cell wall biosynthesis